MSRLLPEGIEDFVHRIADCMAVNGHCVIHNPSDHHMKEWTRLVRVDRADGLVERLCPHNVGHPDPDSIAYIDLMDPENAGYVGIHGCDGCCRKG